MLDFFRKLPHRRSRIFWVIFILLSLFFGLLLLFFVNQSMGIYQSIMPRMLSSSGSDRYVYLDSSKLSPEITQLIEAKIPGISAYQIEPHLALTGLAIEIDSKQQKRIKLKLFSDSAQLIKEDSIFSIQKQAPSTNQFIDYVLHSKKGKALIEDGKENAKKIYHQSQNLYDQLLNQIKNDVNPDELYKLKNDPILKQLVLEAFQQEISSKINFKDLGGKIMDSSEFSELTDMAVSHISMKRVLSTSVKETGKQLGVLKDEKMPKDTQEWFNASKKIAFHYFQCQVILMPCTAPILKDLDISTRAKDVAKGVAKDVAVQAMEGLEQNADQALDASKNIGVMAVEETQILSKSQAFVHNLFHHPMIKGHIAKNYGQPMISKLETAFLAVWDQSSTQNMINEAVLQSKDIIQRLLYLMVLDQNQSGPNPLLLAMIKEKLQKQYEFNINIQNQLNSDAKSVPNGYIFKLEGNLQ